MKVQSAIANPEKGSSFAEDKLRVLLPDHINDQALWNSFRAGDEQALVAIFDRTVRPLCSYGLKIISDLDLVKDSVQELFIELWKNRQNLGETTSIKFYLFTCLRRKLIRLKSKQAQKQQVKLPAEYALEAYQSVEHHLISEQSLVEKRQYVMQLLDRLTKRQREAIFLRYYEEMDYDKIASVMVLSKQVVYNLIHKAITSLKRH